MKTFIINYSNERGSDTMKIIVISDTHGDYRRLEKVFLRVPDAEWYIHLGDGEHDLDRFIIEHSEYTERVIHVAGNCDTGSLSPATFELPLPGHRIFATHGHHYGVRGGLGSLKTAAISRGCDIVLYGHTHIRCNKTEDGLYIMNPGSAGAPHDGTKPSFGLIDISSAGILMNIADI